MAPSAFIIDCVHFCQPPEIAVLINRRSNVSGTC